MAFGAPASQTQGITGVSASEWTRGDDTDWNGGSGNHPAYLFGGEDVSGKFKTGTYTGDGVQRQRDHGAGLSAESGNDPRDRCRRGLRAGGRRRRST